MAAYPYLVRNPFSWLAALSSLLAFSHSISFQFLAIFIISLGLILCPGIICYSKLCEQKSTRKQAQQSSRLSTEVVLSKSSLEDKIKSPQNSLKNEDSEVLTVPTQTESPHQSIEKNATKIAEEVLELKLHQQEDEKGGQSLVRSSESLLSDSESHDQTTSSDDYSENDSLFRENPCHNTSYSDGSISDEESLIEIAIPTGHYVDSKSSQEQPWYGFQQKWPDCSLESHFRQQNWMDMLSEMNEENFIEFDICKGSIKCSRFEIQA